MTRHASPDARGEFLLQLLQSGRPLLLRKYHRTERMEMIVAMPDGDLVYDITPIDAKGTYQ